jgi:hypothetical protein
MRLEPTCSWRIETGNQSLGHESFPSHLDGAEKWQLPAASWPCGLPAAAELWRLVEDKNGKTVARYQ